MKCAVFGKILKEEDLPSIREVFSCLDQERISFQVNENYLEALREKLSESASWKSYEKHEDLAAFAPDCIISLGGDGTILSLVPLIRNLGIPVMGINLGRLGFLSNVARAHIAKALMMLKKGRYDVEERSMLYLESDPPLFGDTPFALNDCTLLKRDTSSMITIHVYVNGDHLNSYWADGIIIATPTGSTGYSLSCGGPIVFPYAGVLVITPVAPHHLNARPVVIPDTSVLSFEIEGRSESFLCTLDSRFELISNHQQIAVRRCEFGFRHIQLHGESFLNTLRDKLEWGHDTRN